MIDKTKPPPLYARINVTEGFDQLRVKRNGDVFYDAIEVDVLGCWATRWQRTAGGGYIPDDDGCACIEKIYGFFTLEWRSDDEPEHLGYHYGMGPFF